MIGGISQDCTLLRRIAAALREEPFTIIDVGCSGGIDDVWRGFGDRLRAFGFDPNIEECKRLAAQESNPGVKYIPAFVGLDPKHPFAQKKVGKSHWGNNPWDRLAFARTVRNRQKEVENLPPEDRSDKLTTINVWNTARSADSSHPVLLPEFFAENGITDIDFIKLDVDGPDFEILHSLEDVLAGVPVLGFGMEVNFFGSDAETEHTFHNTDRFMRSKGFELFNLMIYRYTAVALPSRYLWANPGPSELGRPYQGDALYVHDICNPAHQGFVMKLSPEKILKTAAIFAAFNLPDSAAEILATFRARIAHLCDVDSLLEVLAAEIQSGRGSNLCYKDYLAAFERDSDLFYRPKSEERV